jgi:hypothetical protein
MWQMNFPKIFLEQIIVIEIMVFNEKSGLKKMSRECQQRNKIIF